MKKMCIFATIFATNLSSALEQSAGTAVDRYSYEVNLTEGSRKTGNVTEEDIVSLSRDYLGNEASALRLNLKSDQGKKDFRESILAAFGAVKTFSDKYIVPSHLISVENPKTYKITLDKLRNRSKMVAQPTGTISLYVDFSDIRYKKLSKDGWLFILCHEATHHNGSGYKHSLQKKTWAGTEGLTDYGAVFDCLPSLYSSEENEIFVKENLVSPDIAQICQRRFDERNKLNLCYRLISAGQSFSEWLYKNDGWIHEKKQSGDLNRLHLKADIKTPDTSLFFNDNGYDSDGEHPSPQCRLDTIVRAALQMAPPPCLDGVRGTADILKVEVEFDYIYGGTNLRAKVCRHLLIDSHMYAESYIQKRCDWGNCVRFMRKYGRTKVADDQIDIQYLYAVMAEVDSIHKKMAGKYSSLNLSAVANSSLLAIDVNQAKNNTQISEEIESFRTCKSGSSMISKLH